MAESNAIPRLTLKLGKFKAFMGKHNLLHTHAFPFVEEPLANVHLLGGEGFNDVGISGAYLFPTSWYSELTLQYMRGKGENAEFNAPSPAGGVGVFHWKNLLDITSDTTVETGLSYANGGNSLGARTSLGGVDFTLKWRPSAGGRYSSFLLASEFLFRDLGQQGMSTEKGSGLAVWTQYQFLQRWRASYRFDNFGVKESVNPVALPNGKMERHSVGICFEPTEFSSYRLEMNRKRDLVPSSGTNSEEKGLLFQANFTIGAHPSHQY